MSNFFSKPFRNIIGSKTSENITQGTTDKWLAPESKDFAEKLAVMLAAPAVLESFGVNDPMIQETLTGAVAGGMNAGGAGGAVMGALTGILPNLPGDMGKFFQSGLGQGIMQALGIGAGGDISHLGDILDRFGLSGKQKDIAEELLTMAALAAFSNKFAKDALNKAKEYETYEQATVRGLMDTANSLSDPKLIEQNVQKSLEKTNQEYARAQQQTEQDLYSRGLGLRTLGMTGRIEADRAEADAAARRDIETQAPLNAMQAQAAALGPLQNLSERLRTSAEAERAMPFNAYMAFKEANKPSPMEDYYKMMIAQNMANQQAAAPASGGIAGGLASILNPQTTNSILPALANAFSKNPAYGYGSIGATPAPSPYLPATPAITFGGLQPKNRNTGWFNLNNKFKPTASPSLRLSGGVK